MKIVLIVLAVLFVAPVAYSSCSEGCIEHAGVCACDTPSIGSNAGPTTDPNIVSTDTPSKHPQASWERGEVKVDMPQNLIAQDSALDEEKRLATTEGMKSAGIPTPAND